MSGRAASGCSPATRPGPAPAPAPSAGSAPPCRPTGTASAAAGPGHLRRIGQPRRDRRGDLVGHARPGRSCAGCAAAPCSPSTGSPPPQAALRRSGPPSDSASSHVMPAAAQPVGVGEHRRGLARTLQRSSPVGRQHRQAVDTASRPRAADRARTGTGRPAPAGPARGGPARARRRSGTPAAVSYLSTGLVYSAPHGVGDAPLDRLRDRPSVAGGPVREELTRLVGPLQHRVTTCGCRRHQAGGQPARTNSAAATSDAGAGSRRRAASRSTGRSTPGRRATAPTSPRYRASRSAADS